MPSGSRSDAPRSLLPAAPAPRPSPEALPELTVRELDRALDAGAVEVHYQPCHDLRSGAVVAVEALARLRHEERLLPPAAFLPLAEASGRVRRVDDQVADAAVRQLARWRTLRGLGHLCVAVNVSAAGLSEQGWADRLLQCLLAADVPADALVVELTETAVLPADAGCEALQALAEAGANVTLDDFSTGYSTLRELLRLPVSGIKVDRCFVAASGTPRGRRVLAALQALGDELGVHVVAEGIETPEQHALLRSLGTPYGQGFLMARPMPADRCEEHLLAGRPA